MAFGINFSGPSGFITIDQDFSNYIVTQEGTLANGATFPALPTSDSILLLAPINDGAAICRSGANTIGVNSGSAAYAMARPASSYALNNSDYGLQVFTGNGAFVFDSNSKYIRPKITVNAPTSSTGQTFSLGAPATGRRYMVTPDAIRQLGVTMQTANSGLVIGEFFQRVNSSSVKFYQGAVGNGPPIQVGPFYTTFPVLIFEV